MSQGQYKSQQARQEKNAQHIYAQSGEVRKDKKRKKKEKPHGKIGRALEKIPYAAGVALCVLMLALSLFTGNARALSMANGQAMEAWRVSNYVSGRIGEARNLLKLCERNDISFELVNALEEAIDGLERAQGVADTMRGNQTLETAASNVSAALLEGDLSSSDEKSLSRVMDELREQGNFLRQQARTYNEKATEALELYRKLPARFLLKAPEIASL